MILPLGHWVLEEACRQAVRWQREMAQPHPFFMSVNLSPRQVQYGGLVEEIARILQETGLDPTLLELEITESVVMEQGEETLAILRELKALGVRLAIDDFGTGYSSLAYLKRYPIDTLKIDRAFIDKLGDAPEDAAIIRAIIVLADTLGMRVTGEGVETAEQLAGLQAMRCDFAQGFYLARPMPHAAASALLAAPYLPEADTSLEATSMDE